MFKVNGLLFFQIYYFLGQTACQFGTIRLIKVKYDDRLALGRNYLESKAYSNSTSCKTSNSEYQNH